MNTRNEAGLIPLARLDTATLTRLAALHSEVMHTLLSELGPEMVLKYYQAAQQDPAVLGVCSLSASGEVEGWAMGSPDPSGLNARLRQPAAWFAGQIARLIFTRPTALLHLAASILNSPAANQIKPGQVELTYIGVAPSAQGKGLGKALLAGFCASAKAAGYASVSLSVERDNPAALALYTGSGFKITHSFREGRFERHRMEYSLA